MDFKLNLNKISLAPARVLNDLTPCLKKAMDYAEEWLIQLMGEGIDETSTAPHEWRDALKKDLKHVEDYVTAQMIKYVVGVDYPEGSLVWLQAMVIAYGMGRDGLNGNAIMAGPYGREVIGKHPVTKMMYHTESRVHGEHEIPDSWYHAGGWFIHYAIENMKIIFEDAIQEGLIGMNKQIHNAFYRNLIIKKR